MKLVPVNHDPFAAPKLVPVEGDPFATGGKSDALPVPPVALEPGVAPGPMLSPIGEDAAMRPTPGNAKVAVQALGKAGADILGTPGDLHDLGQGGTDFLFNKADNGIRSMLNWALGTEIPRIERQPMERSAIGSDSISDVASQVAESAGMDVANREDMTPEQRLWYDITRYGAQAGIGGSLLKQAAVKSGESALGSRLMAPYAENATKTIIGDVGGGVGVGAALNAYENYGPKEIDIPYLGDVSPLAQLLVAIAGGTAGVNATSLGRRLTTGAADDIRGMLPAPDFKAPGTIGFGPRNKDVDTAAAFLQGKAGTPEEIQQAIASITAGQDFINDAGGTMPTTGLMTDNQGLRSLEKANRLDDPVPFMKSDDKIKQDAQQDIANLRPDNADPYAPRRAAEEEIGQRRDAAEGNVRAQESQLAATLRQIAEDQTGAQRAEADVAADYMPFRGGASDASADLDRAIVDDTMRPMQRYKNELYENIDPEGTTYVPADNLQDVVGEMRRMADQYGPNAASEVMPQRRVEDMLSHVISDDTDIPMVPYRSMTNMRKFLSQDIGKARKAGDFMQADNLKDLKGTIDQSTAALANTGGSAGGRAREAEDFYRREFAPRFGQGEGGKLRKEINADDLNRSNTQPTKTAGRFLKEGPGGQEAAADMQRILQGSPSEAAGRDAARRYVLDSLASTTIGADGRINENALQRWVNNRSGMLSQTPELRSEVNNLLSEVRRRSTATAETRRGGETSRNRMLAELEGAKRNLARTEQEINKSALSMFVGKNPENAVRSVLSSGDPAEAAAELVKSFGNDRAATDGLKAATADYLANSITDVHDIPTFNKLTAAARKNAPALKAIFGDDYRYLAQARTRMEMLARRTGQAVPGSQTVENKSLLSKLKTPAEVVFRMMYGALEGGSKMRKFKLMSDQLPDSTAAANELVKRAMFDPQVAKLLLAREVDVGTPAWNKQLRKLMNWTIVARASTKDDEDEVGDKGAGQGGKGDKR